MPVQAQRLRQRAEEMYQAHRERGGYAAQRDPATPRETRDALFELKKQAGLLWQQANDLVKAAGDYVLQDSQV